MPILGSIAVIDRPQESIFPVSLGTLYPILAQHHTARHDVKRVRPGLSSCIIKPGMFQSSQEPCPQYMPPGWSTFTHPKGKAYFCRNSRLNVVTEASMYDTDTANKVCAWVTEVERLAEIQDLELHNDVELFIEMDEDDCSYYLVDHAAKTLLWLSEYTTIELGLKSVVSDFHLKLLLEAQYWSHIEKYCMHFGGLSQKVIDDLTVVFLNALAGNLTSKLSTFPYSTEQCQIFLELLKDSRDHVHEGHVVAYVGRIWSVIFYNRYHDQTYCGQKQLHLFLNCPDKSTEVQWTPKTLSSLFLFRTLERYLTALDSLYVDQYVYRHVWNTFMGGCLKTWCQDCGASAVLLLLQTLRSHPASSTLAYTSSISAVMSLLTGVFLLHRHEEIDNVEAHEAQTYLNGVRSDRFKFQAVALSYSLPRFFSLIGFLALFCQWIVLFLENYPPIYAIPLISLTLAIFMGLQRTTAQTTLWCIFTAKMCQFFQLREPHAESINESVSTVIMNDDRHLDTQI